jgi:hypothetical protein
MSWQVTDELAPALTHEPLITGLVIEQLLPIVAVVQDAATGTEAGLHLAERGLGQGFPALFASTETATADVTTTMAAIL